LAAARASSRSLVAAAAVRPPVLEEVMAARARGQEGARLKRGPGGGVLPEQAGAGAEGAEPRKREEKGPGLD
jgi:hypothetical protein